jgi:hypothetical protein
LPRILRDGEHSLRVSDVSSKVKILLADNSSETAQPGDLTTMPMKVPTSKMAEFQRNLEVVKEKFGKSTGDEGTTMSRLMEFAAACTVDESVESYKVGGILNLKRNIESLAPGFTVLLVQTETGAELPADTQVLPATHIYRSKVDDDFVIATDISDAARMLNTDEATVEEIPLGVSDKFSSTDLHSQDQDIWGGLPDPDSIPADEHGAVLKTLSVQLTAAHPDTPEQFAKVRDELSNPSDPTKQFEDTYYWMINYADLVGFELTL